MNLVDCIAMQLLSPYVDDMVSGFLQEPKSAPYVLTQVGLLIGVYNLAEMVFSPLWGIASNYIGRRPALLIGFGGTCIMPLVFGASTSLQLAFIARFLNGVFSGNTSVTKTYLAELVDESNEARAFSMLSFCYGLGMIIGPLMGGSLVHPANTMPVFQHTVFQKFPYLLPNLVYSCLAACAWLLGFFVLEETLPKERRKAFFRRSPSSNSENSVSETDRQKSCRPKCSCLSYPPELLRIMCSYGLVVCCVLFTTNYAILFLQIPRSENGFNFSTFEIGILQNCAAAGLLTMQLLIYPAFVRRWGYRFAIQLGCALVLCVLLPLPLYSLMADPATFGLWRFAPLAVMMFVQQAGFGLCTPTTTVWINRYAAGVDRGAVNGYTNSFAAFLRFLAPTIVTSLLSAGLTSGIPGGRYWPVLCLAGIIAVALCMAAPILPGQTPSPSSAKVPEQSEGDNANQEDTANQHATEQISDASEAMGGSRSFLDCLPIPAAASPSAFFANDLPATDAEIEEEAHLEANNC